MSRLWVSCLGTMVLVISAANAYGQPAVTEAEAVADEASINPGINDSFLAPELNVDEWIARFEVESREVFAARNDVLAAMALEAGDCVADIGAGTGLYTALFAQAVGPEGTVYAVDISAPFLQHINDRTSEAGLENVTCVLGTDRSVRLPFAAVDLVFICDTYHHFEYPQSTLSSIHRALRPGGRLVLIDFERIEGVSSDWVLGHVRDGKHGFRGEIEAAGFEFVDEVEIAGLLENYCLIFSRPEE